MLYVQFGSMDFRFFYSKFLHTVTEKFLTLLRTFVSQGDWKWQGGGYTDKSSEREEDVYLSDTILDQVFSSDVYIPRSSETPIVYYHTALLPSSLDNRNRKRQHETSMPYEDKQFDAIISNAGVNSSSIDTMFKNTLQNHKRFKSNHAYHQQGEEQ